MYLEKITEKLAKEIFLSGGEVWVYTGDYGEHPMYEYEIDEDGDEIVDDKHRLMHPLSLELCDSLSNFIYNNYYTD
jgi:hypothetical protein